MFTKKLLCLLLFLIMFSLNALIPHQVGGAAMPVAASSPVPDQPESLSLEGTPLPVSIQSSSLDFWLGTVPDPDFSTASDAASAQTSDDLIFEKFDVSGAPFVDADAYILVDSKTGVVICSKNADRAVFPASTTKIMTGILAIELGDPEQLMIASPQAIRDIGPNGGNIGIIAGEEMKLDNLLDALLVKSANETSNIIAENLFDTRQEFIDLMNQRARELNAFSTNFTNTNGFHQENHYSTASDLARITRYAMKNNKFREYVAKRYVTLEPTNKHSSWDRMTNTNTLLRNNTQTEMEITGVKTGFTNPAGFCVVASAIDTLGEMELIAIVLGVSGDNASDRRFSMTLDLLKYGFSNFKVNTFVGKGDRVDTITVKNAQSKDTVEAVSDGTIKLFLPSDSSSWSISKVEYIRTDVVAPVAKGEVLGYIEYRNNGKLAGKVDVIAAESIPDRNGSLSSEGQSQANAQGQTQARTQGQTQAGQAAPGQAQAGQAQGQGQAQAGQGLGQAQAQGQGQAGQGQAQGLGQGQAQALGQAQAQEQVGQDQGQEQAQALAQGAPGNLLGVGLSHNNSGSADSVGADSSEEADEQESDSSTSIFQNPFFQVVILGILSIAVIISFIITIRNVFRSRETRNGFGNSYGSSRSKTIKDYRKRKRRY